MTIKIMAFIGILTIVSGVAAGAANWSGEVRIASIEVSNVNTAGVWLTFNVPPYPSHTCSVKNGQYMLGGGQDNINKMTAIATSVFEASRTVSVFWSGCSGGGTSGYPVLLGLRFTGPGLGR
jgi:hypothetical protein